MELIKIKDFARDQGVTYQAVRKQIIRYHEELETHIVIQDRTQYLDQWAVNFLKEHRRSNPVIFAKQEQSQEIENLKNQVALLTEQLLSAQQSIINLQDEKQGLLEVKAKYDFLLEDREAKKAEVEELRKQCDEAKAEASSFKKSIFGFYRKV